VDELGGDFQSVVGRLEKSFPARVEPVLTSILLRLIADCAFICDVIGDGVRLAALLG
jgi:hypothetical protein